MDKKFLFVIVLLIVIGICMKVLIDDANKVYGNVNFEQTLIKTNTYIEGMKKPFVKVLKDSKSIETYLDIFNDEQLRTKLKEYDDDFFVTKALVVIAIQESSGSNSNTLKSLKVVNNRLEYIVDRSEVEVGTCDMAMNYIVAEVSKAKIINLTDDSLNVKSVIIE